MRRLHPPPLQPARPPAKAEAAVYEQEQEAFQQELGEAPADLGFPPMSPLSLLFTGAKLKSLRASRLTPAGQPLNLSRNLIASRFLSRLRIDHDPPASPSSEPPSPLSSPSYLPLRKVAWWRQREAAAVVIQARIRCLVARKEVDSVFGIEPIKPANTNSPRGILRSVVLRDEALSEGFDGSGGIRVRAAQLENVLPVQPSISQPMLPIPRFEKAAEAPASQFDGTGPSVAPPSRSPRSSPRASPRMKSKRNVLQSLVAWRPDPSSPELPALPDDMSNKANESISAEPTAFEGSEATKSAEDEEALRLQYEAAAVVLQSRTRSFVARKEASFKVPKSLKSILVMQEAEIAEGIDGGGGVRLRLPQLSAKHGVVGVLSAAQSLPPTPPPSPPSLLSPPSPPSPLMVTPQRAPSRRSIVPTGTAEPHPQRLAPVLQAARQAGSLRSSAEKTARERKPVERAAPVLPAEEATKASILLARQTSHQRLRLHQVTPETPSGAQSSLVLGPFAPIQRTVAAQQAPSRSALRLPPPQRLSHISAARPNFQLQVAYETPPLPMIWDRFDQPSDDNDDDGWLDSFDDGVGVAPAMPPHILRTLMAEAGRQYEMKYHEVGEQDAVELAKQLVQAYRRATDSVFLEGSRFSEGDRMGARKADRTDELKRILGTAVDGAMAGDKRVLRHCDDKQSSEVIKSAVPQVINDLEGEVERVDTRFCQPPCVKSSKARQVTLKSAGAPTDATTKKPAKPSSLTWKKKSAKVAPAE